MVISSGWWASSLAVAAEDRQQFVQPSLHPPEVANVALMDGIRIMAKMVVGELLQLSQFGVDGGGAGEVGVGGGLLGVHRRLRDVIDDMDMNALFDQEAKLFLPDEGQKSARKTLYLDNNRHLVNV
jgi:hypothetical protein